MKTSKRLLDELSRIGSEMREISAKAEKEDRGLTGDETEKYQSLRKGYEDTEERLERAQYEDSKEREMDETIERAFKDSDGNAVDVRAMGDRSDVEFEERKPNKAANQRHVRALGRMVESDYGIAMSEASENPRLLPAWDAFCRYGENALTPEDRALVAGQFQRYNNPEQRAQMAVGTDAAGGYTVPEGFSNQLEVAMAAYGGIRNVATTFTTSTGNNLPWPTVNDTSNTGAIIAEGALDTGEDVTFSEVVLNAYTYTSKVVRASVEILQDSAFDMQSLLVRLFGERLGRITATHLATGTGSSQPNGLMTAATVGVTAASATAVTWNELLDLEHSVDPVYREGGAGRFVFNDTTFKELKQLLDANNRPLWQPAVGSGADAVPATIDGYPFSVDIGVANTASLARSVAFGDMSKYLIRQVRGFTMVVLREKYALNRQVGYNAFMRMDSELLDAGTNPIKCIVHPT